MLARRLASFAAATAVFTVAGAGVGAAAIYPPAVDEDTTVVLPGVLLGVPAAGAESVAISADETTVGVTVPPGEPVIIAAAGFASGAAVDTSLASDDGESAAVGTFEADADGLVTLPPLAFNEDGTYTLTMTGAEGDTMTLGLADEAAFAPASMDSDSLQSAVAAATTDRVVEATIVVDDGAADDSDESAELAATGGNGLGALWVGGALLAVGAGFVVTTARRVRRPTS